MTIDIHRGLLLLALIAFASAPLCAADPSASELPVAPGLQEDDGKADAKEAKQDDDLLKPKRRLTEKEISDFEELLSNVFDPPRRSSLIQARSALAEAVDDFEKKKEYSPLIDAEAWRTMLEKQFIERISEDRASGTGRVRTEEFVLSSKGEHFVFEYSFALPRGYSHDKAWPVLICIHDEESDGKDYLREIWHGSRDRKGLCENFILFAPHITEKTPRKKARDERGNRVVSTERRVDWFDSTFLRMIFMPFNELRGQYNCDPSRIFVEGVGKGGDIALHLAAYFPGRFAGVVNRHGAFRNQELVTALGGTPILQVTRAGGPATKDGERQKDFADAIANKESELSIERFEAEDIGKIKSKMMGDQNTDPVMEACPKIAEFIAQNSLSPYPKKLRFHTDDTRFRLHPLVLVSGFSPDDEGESVLDAEVEFDREKNRIVVKGKRVLKLTFFLNDLMLDLDKPIEVVVNDITVENRVVVRELERMVRDMLRQPHEYHRVVTAILLVSVPEPVEEEKTDGEKTDGEKADGEKKDGEEGK